MKKILIAGGSGLVGSNLVKIIQEKNREFVVLSRNKSHKSLKTNAYWNPAQGIYPEIDPSEFELCINLCGAGIFDKKITSKRLKILETSRTQPIRFLSEFFKSSNYQIPHFISVSGTGFYPPFGNDLLFSENHAPSAGPIPELVSEWEQAASEFYADKISILRTGVVLDAQGGFLERLNTGIPKLNIPIPGSGKQHTPWIHAHDLAQLMLFLFENQNVGIFNAVAPEIVTLKQMIDALRKYRGTLLPSVHIPVWVLNLVFGEIRTDLIIGDQMVKADKVMETGFKFQYSNIQSAIDKCYPI